VSARSRKARVWPDANDLQGSVSTPRRAPCAAHPEFQCFIETESDPTLYSDDNPSVDFSTGFRKKLKYELPKAGWSHGQGATFSHMRCGATLRSDEQFDRLFGAQELFRACGQTDVRPRELSTSPLAAFMLGWEAPTRGEVFHEPLPSGPCHWVFGFLRSWHDLRVWPTWFETDGLRWARQGELSLRMEEPRWLRKRMQF
jgi:hypothetical protein